jgi:hypothetical protein
MGGIGKSPLRNWGALFFCGAIQWNDMMLPLFASK